MKMGGFRDGGGPGMTLRRWAAKLRRVRVPGPWGYLHVPKAAGTALTSGLVRHFGEGSLGSARFDRSLFGAFDGFDDLAPEVRATIAVSADEVRAMSSARLVAGHFYLSSLELVTSADRILTALREPRCRLLSQYDYWRQQTPDELRHWQPYDFPESARAPLAAFLANRKIAASSDNVLCRMLLGPDRRLPLDDFISPDEHEELALAAIARLQSLKLVAIVERGSEATADIGRAIGARIQVGRENVAPLARGPSSRCQDPAPTVSSLLEARTGVDARIYLDFAARACGDHRDAQAAADEAFRIRWASAVWGPGAQS